MGSRILRTPSWIIAALNLDPPQAPTMLDTDLAVPTVDLFQGGLGVGAFALVSIVHPQNTAETTWTVTPAQPDKCYMLYNVFAGHTGGAAPLLVKIQTFDSSSGLVPVFAQASVAAGGGTAVLSDFGTHCARYFVPPGFGINVTIPATGAGEGLTIRFLVGTFPAGFKPY